MGTMNAQRDATVVEHSLFFEQQLIYIIGGIK
jgi:hypothetical protein